MIEIISMMMGVLFFGDLISVLIVLIGILLVLCLNLIVVEDKMVVMEGVMVDGLSLGSLILTFWICLLIFMVNGVWGQVKSKVLMGMVMMMLVFCFFMSNVFSFFIFFEMVLIPMFLLVVVFGNYSERLEGGFYLLFYTMLGSVPLLIMIMNGFGESWSFLFSGVMKENMNVGSSGSMMMILAFLSKLPSYGVHIWLPKAHVEAPTIGSMILAGVLLKLGGYGIFRFLPILNIGVSMKSLIMVVGLWGGVSCGVSCLRQNDMKKLVAYSSVVHMGLILASSMSYSEEGWIGMLMMMICHGLCSSGMFFFVNLIYERVMTRSMMLVKGCGNLSPNSMMWCFLLVVVNSGCPPFLGMFSESLMVMSLMKSGFLFLVLLMIMLFISVGYNIYFYSMINHGDNDYMILKLVNVQEYYIVFMHFYPVLFMVFVMESFLF